MRVSVRSQIKSVAAILLTLVVIVPTLGNGKKPDFPYERFRANEDVANWLAAYDWCAWHSSDLVMQEPEEELERLGSEWFCFESSDRWHAVYGRFEPDADKYVVVFHYVYNDSTGFVKTDEPIKEQLLTIYGRALRNTRDRLPEEVNSLGIRFNTYIRTVDNGAIDVWVLPAGQHDGTLVYGGEIHYVYDPLGKSAVSEEMNFAEFYGSQADPDLELDIDRQENDVPSVGDIFFLLSFRSQFAGVTVWNRCSLTKMLDVDGGEVAWLHAMRERPECTRKAKKRRARAKKTQG